MPSSLPPFPGQFFSGEMMEQCRDAVDLHNAQILTNLSLLAVFLLLVCSAVPLFVRNVNFRFPVFLCAAGAELVLHLVSRALRRAKACGAAVFHILFCVFFAVFVTPGFYAGILYSPDNHTVIALLFLLCSQTLFVVSFFFSLALNVITASVFTYFTLLFKSSPVREIDVYYIWIAAVAAVMLNRYFSALAVRDMISSRRLEIERDRFREESIKDGLTGLSNRRDYQSAANYYISVCRHVHQTVCAIMLDVDCFKNYNDCYGHQKGDDALKALGEVLKKLQKEEMVFAARVGGEEFIVLWTENRIAEAERIAIRLNHLVAELKIPHEHSDVSPWLTVSQGLYVLRGGSNDSVDDLYREADRALYEAKSRGRNCIMLRDSSDHSIRRIEILPPEKNTGRQPRQGEQ